MIIFLNLLKLFYKNIFFQNNKNKGNKMRYYKIPSWIEKKMKVEQLNVLGSYFKNWKKRYFFTFSKIYLDKTSFLCIIFFKY